MTTVGSYEAKTHLPALLARVEAGEEITITRHGTPIARLIPVRPTADQKPIADLIAEMRRFRKGRRLGSVKIKDLIAEGRM